MKYLVYKTRGMFQTQQIDIVDADNFKVKAIRDDYIRFKKGFRTFSFYHADCVEKILKERDAE